jgi:hypothetical protein
VDDVWQRKGYVAHFDPKHKEFSVSANKGEIAAGAKVLPFKVFYKPRSTTPVETMLIVDCGDMEITVRLCGSPVGVSGTRGKRDGG